MSSTIELFSRVKSDAAEWSEGRLWYVRLPILAYLWYAGWRHVADPDYSSWFGGLTFGLHELGHILFGFLGEFLMIAGGSITQIAAPLIAAGLLLNQRDYFGVSVAGAWLSFSMYNLAAYIGDARTMQLPLLSIGGGDTYHDWEYLLTRSGLLEQDRLFSGCMRGIGFVTLVLSLTLGTWLCYRMIRKQEVGLETRAQYLNRKAPHRR